MEEVELDDQFTGTYLPWIGPRYVAGFSSGVRTLVVGESHYESPDMPPDKKEWTRRTVWSWMSNDSERTRFFSAVQETLLGHKPTREERILLWSSLAFMNFVQTPRSGPGDPPNTQMLRASEASFVKTLELLEPRCVLVFSCLSWPFMPPGEEVAIERDGLTMWWYRFALPSGHKVAAFRFLHPRGGLSPTQWHPFVGEAVSLANATD